MRRNCQSNEVGSICTNIALKCCDYNYGRNGLDAQDS
jgi:hypothetical protein